MKKIILLNILIYILVIEVSYCQVTIDGNLDLDSSWQRIVYASEVPSLYDMYKCSDQLIIGRADVNNEGRWQMELPSQKEQVLIRLHVSKKHAPEANLIIGGEDENHGFIGIEKDGKYILGENNNKLFDDFNCSESTLNFQLLEIKSLADKWDRLDNASKLKDDKMSIRKAAASELFYFADTSSLLLPAMYAVHLADEGFNREKVSEMMNNIHNRLGSHSYLLPYPMQAKNNPYTIWLISIMIGGVFIWILSKVIANYRSNYKNRLIAALSQREREVFLLLKIGKTNKEIAKELNVEISTIKSHTNSIFSKLKISSRKDVHLFQ